MKLTYKVKKSIPYIFDHLTNVQEFAAIHPVITKIESTGTNNYLVYETLKIGFIPISFTYPITVTADLFKNKVMMKATVMRLTKITMVFELTQGDGFTVVEEEITFKSVLPIKSMMQNIFKKQHATLFQNMEELVGS